MDVNYKHGYINKTGAFVIPPTFDIAYEFSEGLAKVGFNNNNADRSNISCKFKYRFHGADISTM